MRKRMTALVLVFVLALSLAPQASADSIEDYGGLVNVMIRSETPNTFLDVQTGGATVGLSARIWSYITADEKISGPAYCVNHNSGYPNGYIPVESAPYTANPTMTAAFASGYPLVDLATFTGAHPETAGLTKDELGYATQVSVWAALGQLGVEGTSFTGGSETVIKPTDPAKLRVYNAVLAILNSASSGGSSASVGMRIRDTSGDSDTVDLGATVSLKAACDEGSDLVKKETIGGKEYFTHEFSIVCTSMPDSGAVALTLAGGPAGTILAYGSPAVGSTVIPVPASGSEYSGTFKICVPVDSAAAEKAGSVTVQAAAEVSSTTFYMVNNSHAYEQNFIIADPSGSSATASGTLKWGTSHTDTDGAQTAGIRVLKTGESGEALAGAGFDLDGSGGYHASGVTGADGSITWDNLPADQNYTVTETQAPEGFQIVAPINVTVKAGETSYITVSDSTEKKLRIHKQDAQNGFVLEGAGFRLEQIDGSFATEGRTKSDGIIEFTPDALPYGSYRIIETAAPDGYEKDATVQTVDWDGSRDVDLYFHNVRKMGFSILKVDASDNTPLEGALFDVYKDGNLITTVRTNSAGIATVSGVTEGFYEAVEQIAPAGYVLDSSRHGIHLDPFDPATAENPVLKITNRKMPSLKISKYDGQTMLPLADATFQVYHDGNLLGEYKTDARGEIFLYDLAPGTYLAKEVEAPNTHVVDSTPQEVELVAGADETYSLVFFNLIKPGIHLRKVDSQTLQPLANAKFRITQVGGGYSEEHTTDANGEIDLSSLTPGSYTVTELAAPDHYLIDDARRTIKIEAGENAEFVFTNTKKPTFRLVKLDSLTGERLPGATFRIAKIEDGSHYLDRVTDVNGEINISDLKPGVYSVQETKAPEHYVLDTTEFHVELFPGQMSQLVVNNDVKPDLRIVKKDADTGAYLDGAVFKVKHADGSTLTAEETNEKGEILLKDLQPGVYEVTEQTPPVGYLPARQASQLITLEANKLGTVIFSNFEKPTLTVNKVSSVSGEPLQGAKFRVTYRSNNTETGAMSNLGNFLTDVNGQFRLTDLADGWYAITELESVAGYSIREAVQEVYIKGGEDRVLTFENTPLSALVVYKFDSVSGEAVTGAVFQVKKLTDTSGTGGTVIGQYKTGVSGSFTVTGLAEGTYTVEELSSDSGHVIDSAPQTAYISGKEMDVVELYFGNSPKGSILIKKIDAVTHEPLSEVEFLVTDSAGTHIGNANGKYVTDSAGTILIDNLDPSTTLVVKETRAKSGYVMDDVPQTVKVRAGHTVSLEFRNAPYGGLVVVKVDEKTKEPLSGAVFQITNSSGTFVDRYGNGLSGTGTADGTSENGFASSNGRYVTDTNGQIRLPSLKPGTYVVSEVEAPEHYILNAEPQTVQVNANDMQTLTFGDPRKGTLIVQKRDSVTGAPMEGVTFEVKTSAGEYVANNGVSVTDANGQITLTDLLPDTYIVTETATISGYVLDTTAHSIVVRANDTQTLTVTNKPKGNLVIRKIDSVTKEPLSGAEFKITTANGTQTDDNEGLTSSSGLYVTDENGEIYLAKLNPGSYIVTETKAPANYKLASNSRTVVVRAADTQIVTISNDPLCTLTLLKRDAVTKKGLAHAEFTVKYSDGKTVGTDNGRFVTGADGTVTVSGLTPDATVIVSESRAPAGYVKDDSPKSIVVRTGIANSLTFDDEPTTTLVIRKYIDGTQYEPLAGVGFKVMDSSGAAVGPDDGVFYTDEAGEIVIDNLEPGITVTAREFKTVDGFVLNGNPQDILIKEGQVQELVFWNQRKGSLTIVKQDSVTKQPLPGVQFKVTYADGRVVDTEDGKLSSNGLYETDVNGRITINNVTGTLVVTETKTIPGYTINEGTRTQTVVVNPDDGQTLYFLNDPLQTLTIQKYVTGTATPIEGVEFLVTDSGGAVVGPNNGRYVTDRNGCAVISGLVPGTTITVRETWTPSGYVLNTTPQSILIKDGDAQELTIFNEKKGSLILRKVDSISGEPLEGAEFLITTIDGAFVDDNEGQTSTKGVYRTDKNGEIRLLNLMPDTYVMKEISAPEGYVLDREEQTVKVNANDTQTVIFTNTPKQTVIIQKFIEGTTKPLEGVTYLVTDGAGNTIGSANGEHTTDANGRIVLANLTPGMTIVAKEVRTASGYVLNSTPQTLTVGSYQSAAATSNATVNCNTMTFYDSPLTTLRIHKYISGTANEPLAGVGFEVTDGSGAAVGPDGGIYYSDAHGEIVLYNLEPGTTVNVREVRTVDGFVLDGTPQKILIKSGGEEQSLTFWNQRQSSLIIRKFITGTQTPIQGVRFFVADSSGQPIGPSNGDFVTDRNGRIVITGLTPGDVITAKETQAASGYVLDDNPQSIKIVEGEAQYMTFYNSPKGGLVVQKLDGNTKKPLAGAEFKITTVAGEYVDDNEGRTSTKGVYWTDSNGQIVLSKLQPGTYIVTETKAPDGYTLDAAPQTVQVNENDRQTLTFYNTPIGGVEIIKVSEADRSQRIANTTFEIRRLDGGLVSTVTTDKNGRAFASLEDGGYCAVETLAAKGFKADATPTYFEVKGGKTVTLTITNKPMSGILLHKIDAATGKGIYGVTFLLYDGGQNPMGQYSTDNEGYIRIEGIDAGRYYFKELENYGYVVDRELKTVEVKAGTTTEIEWKNTAITGQIQITKTSADYNSVNGWPEGTPIPDTCFEIYNKAGILVDTVRTDKNGVAASRPLPLGRYKITESKAAANYVLDAAPIEVEIEFAGQIVRAAMTNRSLYTNVSIKKTGYNEVTVGQSAQYTLTGIANNSNVSLGSFFWRDTLPVQAVRLDKIVTGTWNARGNYKLVYRTNYSGEIWRTLSDNLSTFHNYVIDASPTALGLGTGEYVTEFMFAFGTVPANFRQAEPAKVQCVTLDLLANGTQFTNRADAGGVWDGQWIMAASSWTTRVYAPTVYLPRTGY